MTTTAGRTAAQTTGRTTTMGATMDPAVRAARPAAPRFRAPWQTKRGNTDGVRSVVLALLVLPAALVLARYAAGDLGARPVKALYLECGLWAVRFLLLSLAITPARHLLDWPRLVSVRRMVGVAALAYALAHLTIYTASEQWRVWFVANEIVQRFYLTIGFFALTALIALGATSFDSAVRRMGARWRRLHWYAYPVAVLAVLHFYMQSKADVSEAVVMSGLFAWLMLWRALPAERRAHWWAVLALAPAATLITAALEIAWYAVATHIRVSRVVNADLTLPDGWDTLRPAHWVLLASVLVVVLSLAMRPAWRWIERPRAAA